MTTQLDLSLVPPLGDPRPHPVPAAEETTLPNGLRVVVVPRPGVPLIELRLRVPFAEKGDVKLKKIGLELVIRVGGRKRNIVLPSALASFRPRDAKLDAGTLRVRFERQPTAGRQEDGREAQASAREAV